jgi:Spy/CpxP family protein refolding chaperone
MDRDDDGNDFTPASGGPRRSRRWLLAGLVIAIGGATAVGGARLAVAQGMAGHHLMGAHAAMDPAEMERHIGELVDHVLPDGSAAQKARLAGMIRAAHEEMGATHRQLFAAHDRLLALLAQPNVDRAAIENLRAEQIRQIDAASRHLVQAAADASEMLTPEQRQRLFEHLRGHMH